MILLLDKERHHLKLHNKGELWYIQTQMDEQAERCGILTGCGQKVRHFSKHKWLTHKQLIFRLYWMQSGSAKLSKISQEHSVQPYRLVCFWSVQGGFDILPLNSFISLCVKRHSLMSWLCFISVPKLEEKNEHLFHRTWVYLCLPCTTVVPQAFTQKYYGLHQRSMIKRVNPTRISISKDEHLPERSTCSFL